MTLKNWAYPRYEFQASRQNPLAETDEAKETPKPTHHQHHPPKIPKTPLPVGAWHMYLLFFDIL